MKPSAKNPKERIQVCPQCGSPDIQTDFSNAARTATGLLGVMKCNNCKHEGTFFPTIHKKQLKKPLPKKQVKNIKHFDKTFARGYAAYFFGIGGLLFSAVGITALILNAKEAGFINLILGIILTITYLTKVRKNNK